ncbi:MAG: hypothetical protein ACON4E_08095 [Flavobacteriales bacterium]
MKTKSPLWFWIVTTLILLWNSMGILSFFGHIYVSKFGIEELSTSEQALYAEFPLWTFLIFGLAVSTGFFGSIGLLLRKHWSYSMFMLSILAIIPQMVHNVFFTSSIEVFGLAQTITMPILVIVFGVFLIWFSKRSVYNNWYR